MSESPIVFFDGICNLCHWAVRFIIRRDGHRKFRFASLQSEYASRFLKEEIRIAGSVVLWKQGELHLKSTAALLIAKELEFPWPLLYGMIVLPRCLRDWLYDRIAASRYRIFGKRELCHIGDAQEADRFLI